jgi:hypothetical protein
VAAFPATLKLSNRPRAKTDRIIAVSNRALRARHVVRTSIIPKCWWFHHRSIQRDNAVMPDCATDITFSEVNARTGDMNLMHRHRNSSARIVLKLRLQTAMRADQAVYP